MLKGEILCYQGQLLRTGLDSMVSLFRFSMTFANSKRVIIIIQRLPILLILPGGQRWANKFIIVNIIIQLWHAVDPGERWSKGSLYLE